MSCQFGLFIETLAGELPVSQSADRLEPALPWIALPRRGLSRVLVAGDSPPQLLKGDAERTAGPAVVLEMIQHDHQPYLAMLMPPAELRLRVNGMPAGPVSILSVKDQLQIDAGYVLHISSFVQPYIGPPDRAEVDGECLVCRTPILMEQAIYRCPNCALPLHCGTAEGADQDQLQCALATTLCPRCTTTLVKHAGYTYVPKP